MYTVHECYGGWYREPVNRKCRLLPICIFIVPPPLSYFPILPHLFPICYTSQYPFLYPLKHPAPSSSYSISSCPFLYPFKHPYAAPSSSYPLYLTVSIPVPIQRSLSCPIFPHPLYCTLQYSIPSSIQSNIPIVPHLVPIHHILQNPFLYPVKHLKVAP